MHRLAAPEFCKKIIGERQHNFELTQRGRAADNNCYVLCCNAVGSATDGLTVRNAVPPSPRVLLPFALSVTGCLKGIRTAQAATATSNYSGSGRVVANHAGTVFGVEPNGTVFLRTSATTLADDEIVTVTLEASKRAVNFTPARNRRLPNVISMLQARL